MNLLLTDSNTKVLQSPRIRATDSQKATMKIGSRIPIATGSYQTGAATAVVSSLVNTQFQYQDVGVNIEMTPTVHFDHDVTLKIKIEVTSQSGSVTISGVTEPILSQRVVDQVIRLREGEASILGGIQDNQEQQNWTGIPGLSSIPILKYLFGSKDHTIQNDEIVFVVVPHIVRSQELDQANLRAIDTGSGQSIDLRHADNEGAGTNPAAAAAPVVRPGALERPSVGTVPGQSAEAAAPALMAQMRAAAQNTSNPTAPAPTLPRASTPTPPPTPTPASVPSFTLTQPAGPLATGTSFQIPVVLSGGTDIASVPIQLQYDPARLSLINVAAGDLLNRDGQAVALIHRDDGPGNVTVVAARPPGAAGISGTGVVCVLTFQAKAAGNTALTMTRAGAVNSAQQQVPAQAAHVRSCGQVGSSADESNARYFRLANQEAPPPAGSPRTGVPRERPLLIVVVRTGLRPWGAGAGPDAGGADCDRGDSVHPGFSGSAHRALPGQAPERARAALRPVDDARRHRPLQGRG